MHTCSGARPWGPLPLHSATHPPAAMRAGAQRTAGSSSAHLLARVLTPGNSWES